MCASKYDAAGSSVGSSIRTVAENLSPGPPLTPIDMVADLKNDPCLEFSDASFTQLVSESNSPIRMVAGRGGKVKMISAAHDTGGGEAKGWIWRVVKFCVMQFYEMIGDPVFTWRQMRPTATFLTPCDCSSTSPSDSTFCEATHSCKAGTTAPPPSPAGFKLHRGNKEQEAGDKSSVSNSVDIWRVKDDDGTCDAGLKGNLEGDYAEPFQFEMLLPFDTLRSVPTWFASVSVPSPYDKSTHGKLDDRAYLCNDHPTTEQSSLSSIAGSGTPPDLSSDGLSSLTDTGCSLSSRGQCPGGVAHWSHESLGELTHATKPALEDSDVVQGNTHGTGDAKKAEVDAAADISGETTTLEQEAAEQKGAKFAWGEGCEGGESEEDKCHAEVLYRLVASRLTFETSFWRPPPAITDSDDASPVRQLLPMEQSDSEAVDETVAPVDSGLFSDVAKGKTEESPLARSCQPASALAPSAMSDTPLHVDIVPPVITLGVTVESP